MAHLWDYLILTASNDRQAAGYESQLAVRRRAGLLREVGTALVVADPFGRRVGSGGSTLFCLMRVLAMEAARTGDAAGDWASIERILRGLRVLILHAGGDSRRVPAYGPCGKIFSPVPGEPCGPVISTLFDRLYPVFQDMPRGRPEAGQVIVAAGDALMLFDASAVRFDRGGVVTLGAPATPEAASRHGVFCADPDGCVRLFLQKPSPDEQRRCGAIDARGRSILDIAVMSFDAAAVLALLCAFEVEPRPGGGLAFSGGMEQRVLEGGLDLYREVCCALGTQATAEHHRRSAQASGSAWSAEQLARVHARLSGIPFSVVVLPRCEFLHFGTTRQLISSGRELLRYDGRLADGEARLEMNNRISAAGRLSGGESWVEGCRIDAPLKFGGHNVVVGADVDSPLELPPGACLDVIAGEDRRGRAVWFVRAYHVADSFKDAMDQGGTLAGQPLGQWLAAVGAKAEDVWPQGVSAAARTLWDARVFPAVDSPRKYRDWLWMFDPGRATADEKQAFLRADRYSVAEIALLANMDAFYARRTSLSSTEQVAPCDTH